MEWLVIFAAAIFGLLVLRSFLLACFPSSDLARSIEFDISLYGSSVTSSCGDVDSGGGDGGGGD